MLTDMNVMKRFGNAVMKQARQALRLLLYLSAFTAQAQFGTIDSTRLTANSNTVLKTRPLATVLNLPNLTVEQTIGRRNSVSLTAFHSALFFRDLRAMGESRGVSVAYSYYLSAKRSAPTGLYFGPKISYSYLQNSSLLRLLSLFDSSGEASLWSAQAVLGYQLCTRSNIVLDAQGNLGFLHNLNYHRSGLYSQSTLENRTRFGLLPSVLVSVGYRFRHK